MNDTESLETSIQVALGSATSTPRHQDVGETGADRRAHEGYDREHESYVHRRVMILSPLWLLLVTTVILMTACIDLRDVMIFNPCSVDVTVGFAQRTSGEWLDQTLVPAGTVVRIKNVLDDAKSTDRVLIRFSGAPDHVIEV